MRRFQYTPDSEWPVPVTEPAAQESAGSFLVSLKSYADAATLLRMVGALTVIAAMSAFLMQDWSGGSDMERFYLLLGQTALLAVGGFGLSFLMQENKGARVFFGLSLLSVTANMATLGALVFSVIQWGGGLAVYPGFAKWQADPAMLGLALVAGMVVSAPVVGFGYMVLARRSAGVLSILFLFSNLLLLLPVRESLAAGLIAMAGMAAPLWFLHRRMAEDISLRTPEGYFAVAILFAPVLIVIIRSLWLYDADALLSAMLWLMAFVLLRTATPMTRADSSARGVMDWTSLAVALPASLALAEALPFTGTLLYSVTGFAFVALAMELAERAGKRRNVFAGLAGTMLAATHLLALADKGGMLSALLCIGAGISIIVIGRWSQQRMLLVLGGMTAFAGLAHQVYRIVGWVDFSNWFTLAVLGVSAIIAASVLERYGAVIKARWAAMATPSTTPEDDV